MALTYAKIQKGAALSGQPRLHQASETSSNQRISVRSTILISLLSALGVRITGG